MSNEYSPRSVASLNHSYISFIGEPYPDDFNDVLLFYNLVD
jgi:hypothetical protein